MGMMESQMLLLTLLDGEDVGERPAYIEQAEKNLQLTCKEKEKLQKKTWELKRRLSARARKELRMSPTL